MPYIANTDEDRAEMLAAIGVPDMAALWEAAGVHLPEPDLSRLPAGRSEFEVVSHLSGLAARNAHDLTCFLGCGAYDHFVPAVVSEITGRGEFYTAYTPYQPEASQGTLQAMYEYQSAICRLTGMETANASLYDGGTALFEGIMMAIRLCKGKRNKVVVAGTMSPIYLKMVRCYSVNLDVEIVVTPAPTDGTTTDLAAVLAELDETTACVAFQYPNFFGTVEDYREVLQVAADKKIISLCSSYPVALSLLTPPGELGFDIVTGEGQSLGVGMSFGGPYLGYIATKMAHVRQMPGRIVGRTLDGKGREGFVLTLQAREQHIRRDKATSNICTNEGLCALAAIAYMAAVGQAGLLQVGKLCAAKAVYARELLLAIDGVETVDQPGFFNEFVVRLPIDAGDAVGQLIDKGFAAGFPLGRYYPERSRDLIVAVTEKRTREEIRCLAAALESILHT